MRAKKGQRGITPDNLFSDSSCGETGGKKILVAYASGFGSTQGIAEAIGQVFCDAGAEVDIKWIENIIGIQNYDAVVIGSAIQYDQWMPEARKFVITHQATLNQVPVAFFFACLALSKQNEKTSQQGLKYAQKLYALSPLVQPLSIGRFAGELDYRRLPILMRLFFKIFLAFVGAKEGDYRDWDAIRRWSKDVYTEINTKIE